MTGEWQATYEARERYFEAAIGPVPEYVVKLFNMMPGIWPGGCLMAIPAASLGPGLTAYTSVGLTNTDMPTTVQMTDFEIKSGPGDGTQESTACMSTKEPAKTKPGAAGYGYEIMVVAESEQQWPLKVLQWAVSAEIRHDVGLLSRVEEYGGVTAEKINGGSGVLLNVLIAKARTPLPQGAQLPNGTMDVLVATAITDEEMRWGMQQRGSALLERLCDGGPGQISILGRPSVPL